MGAINDSIKIIEMSEQGIDALKAIIDELALSDKDKAAITYGLNLIVWLPKLIGFDPLIWPQNDPFKWPHLGSMALS